MKLSVITVCRNAGAGLQRTVASVLAQSRPPDAYCIQDGDSTDASVTGVLDWLRERFRVKTEDGGRETEGRVSLWGRKCELRIRSEPDGGIYDALNRGIARAGGDVIGLLHADDAYAHPDVLVRVMQAFDEGAEVVYGDLDYVSEQSDGRMCVIRHWRSGAYHPRQLRWGWMPPHPALFVRRDVYERVALDDGLYFDPTYQCAGDYDFILRLFPRLRVPPVYVPDVFVCMRMGGVSNRSLRHIGRKSMEDWRAIRRNRIGGWHTLIGKNLRKVGQFHVST